MMVWVWLAAAAAAVFILSLLASDMKLRIYFTRMKNNDRLQIDASMLFGLFKYHYDIPMIRFINMLEGISVRTMKDATGTGESLLEDMPKRITPEKIREAYANFQELLRKTFGFNKWVTDMLSGVRCTELTWNTRIGVGDAADTAVTTGLIWGFKWSILGFVFKHIHLEAKPRIHVYPQFNAAHYSTEALGVFAMRTWFALWTGWMLFRRIYKVKGGLKAWRRVLTKSSFKTAKAQ